MADEHPLDSAAMHRLLSLGGEQLQRNMARLYSHHSPGRVAALRAALAAGSRERMLEAAHSLRTTSALVGASSIERLATQMEERLESGQTDRVPALADGVETALDALLRDWIVSGLLPSREDGC